MENGSTESSHTGEYSTVCTLVGLLLQASLMWPTLPQEKQVEFLNLQLDRGRPVLPQLKHVWVLPVVVCSFPELFEGGFGGLCFP